LGVERKRKWKRKAKVRCWGGKTWGVKRDSRWRMRMRQGERNVEVEDYGKGGGEIDLVG